MSNKSYNIFKICLLGLIVLFLIVITVIMLWNKNFLFDMGGDYKLVYSEEYDVNEFNKFSFDLVSASIDVEYSDIDKAKIEIYDKSEDNFSISKNNGVLDVKFSKNRYFCFGFCYIDRKVKLYLPKDYDGNFDIVSASGDVYIAEFENVSGSVKTISGEIEIRKMKDISVKSTSGDIIVDSALSLDVFTTSGDLYLKDIPEISFESTSGDVEISNSSNIVGRTTSGEIDAKNIIGSIDFSSISGDVDLNYVTLNQNSSVSTVSGDVEIKLNEPVNVVAKTVSGSRDIYNSEVTNEVTLKISTTSGDIEVY